MRTQPDVNVPSWLFSVLCYHGYKPAQAQKAPLWEGALKAGLQRNTWEGGTWELYHSIFFSELQTAALTVDLVTILMT